MPSNLYRFVTVLIITNLISTSYASEGKQVKLDRACEAAREVALEPRRQEIFQECIHKFKKSETVCKNEAKDYNGNRINGAPLFYELPACEKAFAYRKKHGQ
ncbi:hypothetical protein [Colwellia psychrerythraea]|uniref:Uncharacterized protein n=1 Tax=Colwellia psychrerythraea TaxID=28229 RepID=A0A099KI34_COLPS|nr:hypothetical protein [Colwellia psychrerythraea]KGJ90021.1 hypothetical protein ND2E_3577 [Colwellia psychrerythraea]